MSNLDRGRDTVDLVVATIGALAGVVEHDIFGVEFLDGRTSPRRVVFTEDVAKIAKEQSRDAVRHGHVIIVGACGVQVFHRWKDSGLVVAESHRNCPSSSLFSGVRRLVKPLAA